MDQPGEQVGGGVQHPYAARHGPHLGVAETGGGMPDGVGARTVSESISTTSWSTITGLVGSGVNVLLYRDAPLKKRSPPPARVSGS
jgi:hypothetical protein